jgi:hypothetical protein
VRPPGRATPVRANPSRGGRAGCDPPFVRQTKERRPISTRIRVKPGAQPERWPRASTRPRWPVDAKNLLKNGEGFFSTRQHAAAAGWAGVPIAGAPGATRVEAPGPPWKSLNAAKTASARSKSKPRNPLNPAVQAGFRRTASRRAEPLPTLSHAKQTPARSDNAANSDNSNQRQQQPTTTATSDNSNQRQQQTATTTHPLKRRHPAAAPASAPAWTRTTPCTPG